MAWLLGACDNLLRLLINFHTRNSILREVQALRWGKVILETHKRFSHTTVTKHELLGQNVLLLFIWTITKMNMNVIKV
jgi:hypothetical protein